MATHNPPISIRLPLKALQRLDRASKTTRRSRSFLMQEALSRYLDDVAAEATAQPRKSALPRLIAFGQSRADRRHGRSATEIEAHIRWLRGNA